MLDDERRARVNALAGLVVEAGHQVQVILQDRHRRFCYFSNSRLSFAGGGWSRFFFRKKAQKAICRLTTGLRVVAVQPVQAGAGMGVEHRQRGVFLRHVAQHGQQRHVFEDVGMVAGMKGVAVTEHGVDGNRRR